MCSCLLGPTHLFVGPLVSVHLHHPLAEDVKCVLLLLRTIGTQALTLRGTAPVEEAGSVCSRDP